MIKRKREKNKITAEINITPFTDVILVLLIIFMITTPILVTPGIQVNLPKTQTTDKNDAENIEVMISADGYVYMEGRQIHQDNLNDALKTIIGRFPDKPIVIKADKNVRYEAVMKFMDAAKLAGARRFALAVDNERK